MADPHPDVRLVTISFDDSNGLEVDWDGSTPVLERAWLAIHLHQAG